ncbi:MAG: helix-turn-helix transcriptional regulator [Armatimonadetes bacterium]|nr:helix-turn-helix transcriptional regulator [Armatimonadota bacterium]
MPKTIHSKEHKKLIEKLKTARLAAGFTQKQVAESLKKPQSYISKIEAGEQRIDIIELKQFAALFKKDIDYFIK